jgi:hypothetical protein
VGLLILPLVTWTDSSSKSVNESPKLFVLAFLLAERDIVVMDTPFLKIVTVPVELEEAEIDKASSSEGSASMKGLLFEGLFPKNSNHLPVEAVPSKPHIVGPREAAAPPVYASSIACCAFVETNPFVALSNGTEYDTCVEEPLLVLKKPPLF